MTKQELQNEIINIIGKENNWCVKLMTKSQMVQYYNNLTK